MKPPHSEPHPPQPRSRHLTEVRPSEPTPEPLKCVWSGYPHNDRDCRSRIPASVVIKAWQREMQLNGTVEGFFNFTWRHGEWLAYGLRDGGVRGIYCPTHRSERESRGVQITDRRAGSPRGEALARRPTSGRGQRCNSIARPVARTSIADLKSHVQETVELRGWVHAIRDQKRMQFVVLRDETGLAQLILGKEEQPSELNEAISALTPESAVTVTGLVVADERVKLGGLEIQLASLSVDSPAEPELPVTPESALDKRIDWRYLDLRRPDRRLIFEVQSTVEHAMREYWREQKFIEIHTPKLMGSASESGAELFKVDYFERTAYLAQSPQFYKQMAMAGGFGKVFEIGPVFRANPSFTSRHDTEFTSVDVEIAWIDSHEDVMAFEERWLAHVLSVVAREHGEQITSTFGVEVGGGRAVNPLPAHHARRRQGSAGRARPRGAGSRPRPRSAERAGAVGDRRRAVRQRVRVRHRLPNLGAAFLPHAP